MFVVYANRTKLDLGRHAPNFRHLIKAPSYNHSVVMCLTNTNRIRKLNSPIKTIIFEIIIPGLSFIHVFAKTLHGIERICYTNAVH